MYVAAVILWILGALGLAWGVLGQQHPVSTALVARYVVGFVLFAFGCATFLYGYLSQPMV